MHFFHSKNLEALLSCCQVWRVPIELAHGLDCIALVRPVWGRMAFHVGKNRPVTCACFGEYWEVRLGSCQLDAFSQTRRSFLKEKNQTNKVMKQAKQLIQSQGCVGTL